MNGRTLGQIIGDAVCESIWVFTQNDAPIGIDDAGLMGDINRALDAEGYTIVACPPGSRVVVDRTPLPCEPCGGAGVWYAQDCYESTPCEACGGSGVVEATTTYGLVVEEELLTVPNICNHMSSTFCPRTDHKREPWSYRLAAVALPEDGE